MRKKQTANRKKKLSIIIAALFLLFAVVIVLEKTHTTNFFHKKSTNNTTSGPTAEQKKQEDLVNSQDKQNSIESKGSDQTNTGTPQESSITLEARQDNNDGVTVTTKLKGYSSGTCKLHITNGQKSTDLTADVIFQPEFSTCAGYSVPISTLGKGTWQLTLTVTYSGQTAEKAISFEVK